MKRILKSLGLVVLLVLVIVVARTFLVPSKQLAPRPHASESIDASQVAAHLSGAIRFKTISWEGGGTTDQKKATQEAFVGFHAYLKETFPAVYAKLDHEVIGGNNLLFTWKGSNPSLEAIAFLGHQDVVPIEPGTESNWVHTPFSGEIADGFIWGRGSLDDKMTVIGLLEAVDLLLKEGFKPKRTIYLAFGQDEEIGGLDGAAKIAELLKFRGVQLAFVIDEGGFVSKGLVPGVSAPVALIGTSEKGYLTLELSVETAGGHSSIPPRESSIGLLSAAIRKIETHPMPARARGPVGEFLEYCGSGASIPVRMVTNNIWLFGPIIKRVLESRPDTNALLRTTAATTIFRAGTNDNVMPSRAHATVSFRILPGDTISGVTEHVRQVVDDPRVKLQPMPGVPPSEPSARSSVQTPSFNLMQRTLAEVYAEAIVAPFVLVAATDSRHYASLTTNIYRFAPIVMDSEDVARLHSSNERIAVENFVHSIDFYIQLIRNAAS